MSGITAVMLFAVSLFFSLLLYSLWLRLAIRYFRISSLNPVSQLVYTVTDPLVHPIQKILKPQPGQQYDIATITILILAEIVKILILSLLAFHAIMPIGYFLAYIVADLIIQPCDLLFFAILIRAIMSFVKPGWSGPVADFLRIITEPLLMRARKIIPDVSGFDFSPFVCLLTLKMITIFVSASLPWRLL